MGDHRGLEQLFSNGHEKILLDLDTADVPLVVDAGGTIVVLAETEDLHDLLPVQVLEALVDVDVQILGGVVVVHIHGHFKIYAADGGGQLAHRLPLHHDVEVRGKADGVGNGVHQGGHPLVPAAGVVIDGVDLLDVPGLVDNGVPGDAHGVELLVLHIIGDHHDGVGVSTASRIPPHQQKGIIVLFPARRRQVGRLISGDLRGLGAWSHGIALLRLGVGPDGDLRLDKEKPGYRKDHHHQSGQENDNQIDHTQDFLPGGQGLFCLPGRMAPLVLLFGQVLAATSVFFFWVHQVRPFRKSLAWRVLVCTGTPRSSMSWMVSSQPNNSA